MKYEFTHTETVTEFAKKILGDLYSKKVVKFVILGKSYFYLDDCDEVCFQTSTFNIQAKKMNIIDVKQVLTIIESFIGEDEFQRMYEETLEE